MNPERQQTAGVTGHDRLKVRRLLRAALAGLLLLSLVGQETPALAAAAEDGLLSVSGRVLLPDGSPAAGAVVWAVCGDLPAGVAVVHADAKGEFRLSHEFGWGSSLNARTEDWRLQASLRVPREKARALFARPVEIRLSPAREQLVSVTFQNQPVAGAHVVAVDGANYRVPGLTDREGRARLRLPAGDKLNRIVAWHPAFGAGGQSFGYSGASVPASNPLQVTILPAKPHTIRVVDSDGRPVPNLEIAVNCRTTDWIMTRDIEAAHLQTDARGEALVPWLPRDAKFVSTDLVDPRFKLEGEVTENGQTVVNVRRKRPVTGRLVMPSGADAAGILVTGTGFGSDSSRGMFRVDVPTARTRRDGSFTLLATPDHGYAVGVADSEWACDIWTGVILAGDAASPAPLSLTVYPATTLAVHVTRGPQHAPVAGAWLYLRQDRSFSWKDARGQHHSAQGGVESGLETDENGTALFPVGKGTHSVYLLSGSWREERSVDVSSTKPLSVDFDRSWSDKRTISGQLTVKHKPHKRGPATVVRAWSTKDPSLSGEGVVLPDGRFTVAVDAEDAQVFAFDSGERLCGAHHSGPADSKIDLELAPLGAYSGVVVDANGKPLGGHGVDLVFKGPGFMDLVVLQSTTCDDHGRFKFDSVPVQMPLSIYAGEPASARGRPFETRPREFRIDSTLEFYLDPGEVRENVKLVARPRNLEGQAAAARVNPAPEPLEPHVNRLTRDARLAGMRLLVVLQGDASKRAGELTSQLLDSEELPEILHYLTLTVGAKQMETEAGLLSRLGWEPPKPGQIELLAIDGTGTRLAAERVTLSDNAAAQRQAAQFIKRNAPPRRDARALLAAARQEARDSGRRLCIVEGGPRCGPCFLLARWMDDQHALLAKDYVVLKVLDIDDHAHEVIGKLNPPRGAGIPWFAITEPDGAVLATSDGPLGNTGFPSTFEETQHVKSMLDRTARHLTAAERHRLVESLRQHEP